MLYVCVPTYNEAVTVGVLLWRLRTMLREQAGGRDYEVVVYDDASTDATPDVLAPYARVLPLTVLRGERRLGQTAAVDALVCHVVARSHTPQSDAVVLMQADYTDGPELLPELLALFDGGADLVLTRRVLDREQPHGERRLRRAAALLLPPFARPAIRDAAARDPAVLLSLFRLVRVAVLGDALRAAGGTPLVAAPGWAGTAELVVRTAPFAHRIERVDAPARYDVRTRPSRIDWARELRAVAATLWQHRGASRLRPAPGVAVGNEAGSVSRQMDRSPTDSASDDPMPGATSLRVAPAADAPSATSASALAPVEDTLPEPGAPGRAQKRRRRGRGRQREAAPETHAAETADDERTRESEAAAPHGVPDAAAKRRRRRGGARRRARGSERDSGVRPEDADPAPSHGAPSDQPPS